MRRVLLIGAILFAAGCGEDNLPAPSTCPTTSGWVKVRMFAQLDSDLRAAAKTLSFSISTDTTERSRAIERAMFPDGELSPPVHYTQTLPQHHTITVSAETPDGTEVPGPTALVDLNRNCDLLAEIGLTPGGDRLTMKLSWIEPVE